MVSFYLRLTALAGAMVASLWATAMLCALVLGAVAAPQVLDSIALTADSFLQRFLP